jgi:hypothetical protein
VDTIYVIITISSAQNTRGMTILFMVLDEVESSPPDLDNISYLARTYLVVRYIS